MNDDTSGTSTTDTAPVAGIVVVIRGGIEVVGTQGAVVVGVGPTR